MNITCIVICDCVSFRTEELCSSTAYIAAMQGNPLIWTTWNRENHARESCCDWSGCKLYQYFYVKYHFKGLLQLEFVRLFYRAWIMFSKVLLGLYKPYYCFSMLQWFGEGEKYVKAVFSLASKIAPSVVFVDEVRFVELLFMSLFFHLIWCYFLILSLSLSWCDLPKVDSMLGRRENPGEHEAMRKMKNEFMVNWDGLRTKDTERVLVLAATNRPYDLDEAVIRRLPRR